MIGAALLALCAATASSTAALDRLAVGLRAAARGELEAAVLALEQVPGEHPLRAIAARERALLLGRLGRWAEARAAIAEARAAGDVDPERDVIEARILTELGELELARSVAEAAGTADGRLLAASLGSASAAEALSDDASEPTPRGALRSLVLAGFAAGRGELANARRLLARARAELGPDTRGPLEPVLAALEARGDDGVFPVIAAQTELAVEHATNPLFLPDQGERPPTGTRIRASVAGAVFGDLGPVRLEGTVRVDQVVHVAGRERLAVVDLSGLLVGITAELPIGDHPEAPRVGLGFRFRDAFADGFAVHHGSALEGGPTLTVPLTFGTALRLAVVGVSTDFVDGSPPDAAISDLNRDVVGQRAVATLFSSSSWLDVRLDAAFVRDDARGDAFDAIGGLVSARAEARVEGLVLRTAIGILARRYGPVGDRFTLGAAAKRDELRAQLALGVVVPIGDVFAISLEDRFLQSSARPGHGYTNNVFSLAWEGRW